MSHVRAEPKASASRARQAAAAAAVLAVAVVAALPTGPASAATGTVVRPQPIVIPALGTATPYRSSVEVAALTGTVTDVNVTLSGFAHTFPSDLEILVVGPGGQHVVLLNGAGGGNDVSGLTMTFDDEARAAAPELTALRSGRYRPTDYLPFPDPASTMAPPAPSTKTAGTRLAAFDGTSPNGTWSLYVEDKSDSDSGRIARGWSLSITTSRPAAPAHVPRVMRTTPAPGATGVRVGKNVTAQLSKAVRRGSVTRASVTLVKAGTGQRVPAAISYSSGRHEITINPKHDLARGTTYRVMVGTRVLDLAGGHLDQKARSGLQPKRWKFTTR